MLAVCVCAHVHAHICTYILVGRLFEIPLSQNVIKENPFTEAVRGSESPTLSIGEPLSTIPEGGEARSRKESNPFRTTDNHVPSMWELEKQQMMAQFALLTEQLKAETAQRIESQVE